MKKLLALALVTAIPAGALAQAIQAPKPVTPQSMSGKVDPMARGTLQPVQQGNAEHLKQAQNEAKGYSVAFIAKQYNSKCNLGLSDTLIHTLAGELEKAERNNQITQQTINENVTNAENIYKEDPAKFCNEAQQIAGVIKNMFVGQ